MKESKIFIILFAIILLFTSCSQSEIIKNDVQKKLGDSVYYTNDTSIGNPISFCFSNYIYVSDYVVFNYGSEKMIVIDLKGKYIAYCRIIENKYNQFNMEVSSGEFVLIDGNGNKSTYIK